jgi:hypothetical protein
MKHYFLAIAILSVVSCSGNKHPLADQSIQTDSVPPATKDAAKPEFESYKADGLLLPDKFMCYNDSLKPVMEVVIDSLSPVQIIAKSKDKHFSKPGDDECLKANYLRINYGGKDYIVFGRYVYEIDKKNRFTVSHNDEKIEVTTIVNFELGASDDDGLTGCDDFSYLLLKRLSDNHYSLIENHKERKPYTGDCDYAMLQHDDGTSERISRAEIVNDTLIIGIKVGYQEGAASYNFKVSYNKDKPTGIISDFERMEETEIEP